SGMQKQISGNIMIDGKSLTDYNPASLATVLSVVLTEAPVSKNLTVGEFVSLGRQPHTNWLGSLSQNDKAKVIDAMEKTEILEFKDRKCFELSDGQMQRVAIARALAQDTPLVLLDEPTTHLDLYHRAYVLKLLRNLAKETGKTILYSTHEIDLAIQLSDSMLLMTENKLFCDSPSRLISEGKFNTLFPENTISFDPSSGRFTIQN
ncbi:MAG: ABC transporter ATP-binding protein, partial [Flavobacteriaceae bacterium]|nr:ABC transporter ATP-binding protein [Flavobacteriaceae bacterium]